MKKNAFILFGIGIVFAGLLAGCSAAESNESEPIEDETADVDNNIVEDELTVVYEDNALNKDGESGPLKLNVKGITIGELRVSEENKDIYENKELVTLVNVDMVIENRTDESIWFSPNEAMLTTDTGEKVNADMLISGLIGDPFIGKGQKEGEIVFILDTPAKEISQLNIVIEGAEDEESKKIGDSIEMSFDVK